MSLIQHNEFETKKIQYTKPEKTGAYYYSTMSYGASTPIHIQTPKMKCRCSGTEILDKGAGMIEMEPLGSDYNLYEKFVHLDDRNIKETYNKNKTWFGKEIPLELIDDMYKRSSKPVKQGEKPQFGIKIPIAKGKVQCPVYDQKRTCIDFRKITPECELIAVIHVRGLKFLKHHYYCDMYVSQIKVIVPRKQKYEIPDTYMIEDDEEDETEVLDESVLAELKYRQEREQRLQELQNALDTKQKEYETLCTEITQIKRTIQSMQMDI